MFGFQPIPVDDDNIYIPPGGCSILSSSSYGGKTTSHVVTLPTGITIGDNILLIVGSSGATVSGLGAYSLLRSAGSSPILGTYLKTSDGSEGSTITLTTVSTTDVAVVCYRLGCIHYSGNSNGGYGDTLTSNTPTFKSGDVLELLTYACIDGRTSSSFPAGYSESFEGDASGHASSSVVVEAGWKTIAGTGSETPGSIIIDDLVDWVTIVEVFS